MAEIRRKPLELRAIRGVRPLLIQGAQGVSSNVFQTAGVLLLALGCVTAAAGGAYLATRHNAADAAATRRAAPADGRRPTGAGSVGPAGRLSRWRKPKPP